MPIAVGLVALLAAANLRGVRESGKAFAVPTYLFISGITVMIVTGLIRYFFTDAGLVVRDGAVHGRRRSRRTSSWPGWRCCSSRCGPSPPAAPR